MMQRMTEWTQNGDRRVVRPRIGIRCVSQPKICLNKAYAFCIRARANDAAPLVLSWRCPGCGAWWEFFLVSPDQINQMQQNGTTPVLEVAIHQGGERSEDHQLGYCGTCEVFWVRYDEPTMYTLTRQVSMSR